MSSGRWRTIAVGVDGSTESRQALAWACAQSAPGVMVTAVSVWSVPPTPTSPPFGGYPWGASADVGAAARATLAEIVAELQPDFPEVEIGQYVVAGGAAQELIKLSEHSDVVVVGAKGHGGFTGMLLGSVSQHVLAHSACTVVVVR